MAIHNPVIRQLHVPAVPDLFPLVVAVVLFVILAAMIVLIQPDATPAESDVWMTQQRQGEIDAGHSGPHLDVLLFRAGEINAANE